MNKLLKWAIPAVLSIVPIVGMEKSNVIEDDFFKQQAFFFITDYNDSEVTVKATFQSGEEKYQVFNCSDAIYQTHWEIDDSQRQGREKVKIGISAETANGIQTFEKEFAKGWVDYTT